MPPPRACLGVAFSALSAYAMQGAKQQYQSAMDLLRQGRYAEARQSLEQVVAAEPHSAPAWQALGVAHAAQGDYPAAEPAFARACSLQPKLADACFYHGRALYLVNRFSEALAVLARLGSDRRRYRIEALCHDALGHWGQAEMLYRKAIDNDPGGENPRIDYAVALARQGRALESVPLLEAALQQARQLPRVELEFGRILLQLDRLPDARAHLERAVFLAPHSAQAHLLLGRVYTRLGLLAEAAPHLEQGSRQPQ